MPQVFESDKVATMSARALAALLIAALVLGCGPTSEATSLRFTIGERGAMFSVLADSSTDMDLEVDWAVKLDNLGSQPCAVAVYRWLEFVDPETVARPTVDDPRAWPQTHEDGELIESGIVEPGGTLTLGPQLVGEPAPSVYGQFLLATCPGAQLVASVRTEAVIDLGVRSLTDSVGLSLYKLD